MKTKETRKEENNKTTNNKTTHEKTTNNKTTHEKTTNNKTTKQGAHRVLHASGGRARQRWQAFRASWGAPRAT
jgi:hypothetical protein